jgi:Rhodopirellula transposase DDE domain
MEPSTQQYESLICSAAQRLKGHQRRLFHAEVANALCGGSARAAERRFGWGRDCVEKGLHEADSGLRCVENFAAKGALPSEEKDQQLAADIRAIVEPHTQADPELKSPRRYTNLSAKEVLQALKSQYGYSDDRLPKERTMRDILNRMGYRLKRIQKAKPLKKTKETDAIFANVNAAREQYRDDPETLECSIDTKAKINEGDYSRGGKMQDGFPGGGAQGVGP